MSAVQYLAPPIVADASEPPLSEAVKSVEQQGTAQYDRHIQSMARQSTSAQVLLAKAGKPLSPELSRVAKRRRLE